MGNFWIVLLLQSVNDICNLFLKKAVCSAILINLVKNSLNIRSITGANLIETRFLKIVFWLKPTESPDQTREGHLTRMRYFWRLGLSVRGGHSDTWTHRGRRHTILSDMLEVL
jgi:hypothetical protein